MVLHYSEYQNHDCRSLLQIVDPSSMLLSLYLFSKYITKYIIRFSSSGNWFCGRSRDSPGVPLRNNACYTIITINSANSAKTPLFYFALTTYLENYLILFPLPELRCDNRFTTRYVFANPLLSCFTAIHIVIRLTSLIPLPWWKYSLVYETNDIMFDLDL